jgi:hypothetical protein
MGSNSKKSGSSETKKHPEVPQAADLGTTVGSELVEVTLRGMPRPSSLEDLTVLETCVRRAVREGEARLRTAKVELICAENDVRSARQELHTLEELRSLLMQEV